MIKTYKYNAMKNNVSHILVGEGGNTMRYNFTRGNIITKKHPELTLRSQYAQELLEESELFKRGTVQLVSITDDSAEHAEHNSNTPSVSDVSLVTTPDELLVYVNSTYDRKFAVPAKALAFAAEKGVTFPNLVIGE